MKAEKQIFEWDDENKDCNNTEVMLMMYRLILLDVSQAEFYLSEERKPLFGDLTDSEMYKKDLLALQKKKKFLSHVDSQMQIIKDFHRKGFFYYYSIYYYYMTKRKMSARECREAVTSEYEKIAPGKFKNTIETTYDSSGKNAICTRTFNRYLEKAVSMLDVLMWSEDTEMSKFMKEVICENLDRYNNIAYVDTL